MSESESEKLLESMKTMAAEIFGLRADNERLRELMRRLVEYAKPDDYGDMVVDIDDFNAIEKEVGDE